MKKFFLALILAAAVPAFALDTNFAVRVPCEMQATAGESEPRLASLTWLQGTTPLVVAEPLRRGRAIPYDTDTRVRMVIGPSATGALYAVRTNAAAVTNGYAMQWPTIGTNTAGAAWFYTILFDKDGRTYWTGSGDLYITATTSTASNGLEWIEYTIPSVGWGDIAGDPADNSALVAYVAEHSGGSAEDTVARGMSASNAAEIAIMSTGKLDAAAGVLSNLTAHAADTENPHQVTAEQIGALTAEEDPAFAAWKPSAHVPVACSGGWLYPDYFTLSTTPYAETGVAYSTTSDYNSVLFAWQIISPQKGEILYPSIVHHQDWTTSVSFTNAEVLEIREADGTFYADWPDGTASGAVGRVTAVLGAFSRTLELTFGGATAAKSNAWWVADLPGSFRAYVNASVSNMAYASGKSASVFFPWPYVATNLVFLRNTNFWAASIDMTCASPWNSYKYPVIVDGVTNWHNPLGNYHAGTAITPQHFIYAEHWHTPTNTTFRWIDATNGVHDRTLAAQRFIGNDVAIGLLDVPLPASITPAKCLAAEDIGYLRGKHGLKNAPGFRLINLDSHEYAWQVASPFMENALESYPESLYATGSTNLPYSRAAAVGGDSGNPIFLTVGTNVVLLSTFWTASGGPMLPIYRAPIEAAMIEMGGSAYTNWPAVDLSTWTNYDAGYALPDL